MKNRLLPFLVASMFALPLAQVSGSDLPNGVTSPAPACAAADAGPPVTVFTEAEREAFQIAQNASDPDLGDQRAGGLIVVALLVVLIFVIVD